MKRTKWLMLLVIFAMIIAAGSSDSDDETTTTAAAGGDTETTTTAASGDDTTDTTAASGDDMVDRGGHFVGGHGAGREVGAQHVPGLHQPAPRLLVRDQDLREGPDQAHVRGPAADDGQRRLDRSAADHRGQEVTRHRQARAVGDLLHRRPASE